MSTPATSEICPPYALLRFLTFEVTLPRLLKELEVSFKYLPVEVREGLDLSFLAPWIIKGVVDWTSPRTTVGSRRCKQ
jgi:hypothetical protein